MSSPASKRKRAAASVTAQPDTIQPSSRNASKEELVQPESGPSANTRHGKKHTTSIDTTSTPPSKRARTRSSLAGNANVEAHITNGSAGTTDVKTEQQDPAEPSPKAEDHTPIKEKEGHKRRASRSTSNVKNTVTDMDVDDPRERQAGAEGSRTMKAISKELVHPRGGYRTNPPPEGRQVRVYADGVFDLFHLGHMRQLEQAKTIFPNTYLIVGVTGDAETHRRKGLTVLTGAERAETVRHCKWVDEVIPNCPWIVTTDFLSEHQVDYVAHDDEPYGADEGDDIYGPIKTQGKFLVTQRTEGVSTTGIITKIVKDYEKYIQRQLKRGTSRKELNLSWIKKNEIEIRRAAAEIRDNIKHNWTSAGGEIGRDLKAFWGNAGVAGISRPNSPGPSRIRIPGLGLPGLKSPSVEHAQFLEVPGSGSTRSETPGRYRSEDFVAGYSLGLVGSIKSWMRSRGARDSQNPSPEGSEEDDDVFKSPVSERGEPVEAKKSSFVPSLRGRKSDRSLKSQKGVKKDDSDDPMESLH